MSGTSPEVLQAHWNKTRNLTAIVLAIWFVFSFVVHWFANALNAVSFLGFPLGYYMAAQGSLIVFVALILDIFYRKHPAHVSKDTAPGSVAPSAHMVRTIARTWAT